MKCGDNFVKTWRNVPNSNPKPDLKNISAHIKFGENSLRFTQVIVLRRKYGCVMGKYLCQSWQNLSIGNPKSDVYNINAHSKLVKFHWDLLKLSSGNENMDVSRVDNSVKNWGSLPISIPNKICTIYKRIPSLMKIH